MSTNELTKNEMSSNELTKNEMSTNDLLSHFIICSLSHL